MSFNLKSKVAQISSNLYINLLSNHFTLLNHTQSVKRPVKLTTTPSGRIAGLKKQIGEALRTIAGKKSSGSEKILRHKKSCSCQSIKSKLSLLFTLH